MRSPARSAGLAAAAALAWIATAALPSVADEKRPLDGDAVAAAKAESRFVRVSRDTGDDPTSLDTSIVRCEPADRRPGTDGLAVDLVAAVHIGSKDYYEALSRRFADYESVLYELVAPEHARIPKPGRKPSGAIGQAQAGLTSLLGLEFQLEGIDYAADNFVHADLSPKQFDEAMNRRGESWWTMFGKLMQEGMKKSTPSQEVTVGELFGVFFGDSGEVRLRRIMAVQFTDMEVLTAAFGGENGSTIITDRNKAAIDVLRREIARGRRRIAIFYGAAHMPDFETRLKKEFNLEPTRTEWIEAWDLRMPDRPRAAAAKPR